MNNIAKILNVWESLGYEASLPEIVKEYSKKYHIVNDSNLFYLIKSTMDDNKHLFVKPAPKPIVHRNSNLSKIVTLEKFTESYAKFIEQADENAITHKSKGSKTPFGFDFESNKNVIDGGGFSQHFGQGAATKTPYISWYVVSIYYVVDSAKIILGVEKDRYKHLDEMDYIDEQSIGNKNAKVAIFYQCSKDNINYEELYDKFITVSERVMELGLE